MVFGEGKGGIRFFHLIKFLFPVCGEIIMGLTNKEK